MTEIEIVKELFKAYSNHNNITIILSDGTREEGNILFFDGEKISLSGKEFALSEIMEIANENAPHAMEESSNQESINTQDYSVFKGHSVSIIYGDPSMPVERQGVLFDYIDGMAVLVDRTEKVVINSGEIINLSELDKENSTALNIQVDENHEISMFEQALIDANEELVESFVANPDKLREDGYTEDEIARIGRKPVQWKDDDKSRLYNQARRVYQFLNNRGQLAKKLFMEYLSSDNVSPKNRDKALGTLIDIADGNADDLIELYESYTDVIQKNDSLSWKMANGLIKVGEYERVRSLISDTKSGNDYRELNAILDFYDNHKDYDFTQLPGLDPLDNRTTGKELANLLRLPDCNALIQLLTTYYKANRPESFWALIDLFNRYAKSEQRIVTLVGMMLKKEDISDRFETQFYECPLLWLDKDLSNKYLNECVGDNTKEEKTNRIISQCKRAQKYADINELENALVNRDYELFSVLRSNDSILASLGYDADTIGKIKSADVDELKNWNKTVAEKLFLIEGNRGGIIEVSSAKDFLNYPESISKLLFPILIESDGEAILYELYNYSEYIKEKLCELKPFYLSAIKALNYKDEYWNEIRDEWLTLDLDDESLAYACEIAREKGEHDFADAIELYLKIKSFNEFEKILISGNVAGLRAIVTDADYLIENGYNSDEIKLIQESSRNRFFDFKADDYLAIANRVYAFQKNKNSVAELYYKLAIMEKIEFAALGLVSIYDNEGREIELCNVYEKHIMPSETAVAPHIKEAYLNALFETEQYEKYYDFYKANGNNINYDNTELLAVFLKLHMKEDEIIGVVSELEDFSQYDVKQIQHCINLILTEYTSKEMNKAAATLFNQSFIYLEKDYLNNLKGIFAGRDKDDFDRPESNGILLFALDDMNYLKEWLAFFRERNKKDYPLILVKAETAICNNDQVFLETMQEMVLDQYKDGALIPEELAKYLKPIFNSDEEKIKWIDDHTVEVANVDELQFETCCKIADELNDEARLIKYIDSISTKSIDFRSRYKCEILRLLEKSEIKDDAEKVEVLLRSLERQAEHLNYTADDMILLAQSYYLVKRYNWAFLACQAIKQGVYSNELNEEREKEITVILDELASIKNYTLFSCMSEELSKESVYAITELQKNWGHYYVVDEKDDSAIEELKDYYNSPEKWTDKALDVLAKQIIINSEALVYWRLLKTYYAEADEVIKCNIDFQNSITSKSLLNNVLINSLNRDLKNQTLEIMEYIFTDSDMASFDRVENALNIAISRCPEWFEDNKVALNLLSDIVNNSWMHKSASTWDVASRIAMRIAFCGNVVREYYNLFVLDENSSVTMVKTFLCKLILDCSDDKELIRSTLSIIKNSTHDIPYKSMIITLLDENELLNDVQREMLHIARRNEAETIDENAIYRYYLDSVVAGREDIAVEALRAVKEYYPQLPVFDDIEKYELLKGKVEDDDVIALYNSEFENLRNITTPTRIEKTIGNMIPGELYLKSKGFEIESVYEYGLKTLSNKSVGYIKQLFETYNNYGKVIESAENEFLSGIALRCCFTRQWISFFESVKDINAISELFKSDPSIKQIMIKKAYEVLKGAVISILEMPSDSAEIIDLADAILASTSGVRLSKNYLRRIQKMESEDREALRKVFTLRIESATLRRTGIIGSSILSVPRNEIVAFVIGMLRVGELITIFNNNECLDTLMKMPKQQALDIANIYSTFYFGGEDNVFTRYISSLESYSGILAYSGNPFEYEEEPCKEAKDKYLRQKKYNKQSGQADSKYLFNLLEVARSEYLFDAVKKDSESDIRFINPSKIDYLSTITTLFNKSRIDDIIDYVKKIDRDGILPCFACIFIILEQYKSANTLISRIEDEEWKNAASLVMIRTMYPPLLSKEEQNIQVEVRKTLPGTWGFVIRKLYPKKPEHYILYVEKMRAMSKCAKEVALYLANNEIDVSDVSVDQSLLESKLSKLQETLQEHKEINGHEETNVSYVAIEDTIHNYLDYDYVKELFSEYADIEPIEGGQSHPKSLNECVGIIRFFADNKRDSQNSQDIQKIRDTLRWTLIYYMNQEGYNREKTISLLNLISSKDNIARAQWSAILSSIVAYFDATESLQSLSRMVETDLPSFKNITQISNNIVKYIRKDDLVVWGNIEKVLSYLAGIDFNSISETELLIQLTGCRKLLILNSENKRSSSFSQINNKLLKLISDRITLLRNNPELEIKVLGDDPSGEQTITWEHGNNEDAFYAVISNVGGADCNKVKLISRINMTKTRYYEINKIYSNEKTPIKEVFTSDDLINGKVTWDIELSHYDESSDKTITQNHQSVATIEYSDETLNLGNIITGNPVKGKSFIGRSRELALLRNRYSEEEQLPSMLIRGLKRSGKSSILIRLSEELKKRNKFIVVLIDGQSIGDSIRNAFVDKVLESIRINYRSDRDVGETIVEKLEAFKSEWLSRMDKDDWIGILDIFYYELSSLLGKKILILIDEMESIFYNHRFDSLAQEESLYAALRSLIQKPENYVSFVFCGSDTLLTSCLEQRSESQMFQTLQYLEVGRMNVGDIREIFRIQSEKYDIQYTSDAVDAIWQYTNGLVWYAKLLGYLVINNIFAKSMAIRREVNRNDIVMAVQMLINGEIGTDKYDLVDACLSTPRTAIVHAMASIMPDNNKEVSVDEISMALHIMRTENYINPRTGEQLQELNEGDIKKHLEFLEKMQFVIPNASKTRYALASELYRLFFRADKRIHLFEERGV